MVNQLADIDDGNPTNGMMTLREAVNLANASTFTTDTITFDASLNGQIITLNDQLNITDTVDIQGNGPATLTISGAGGPTATNRIFNLSEAPAGAVINISGLRLANANVDINLGGTGTGGAVLVGDESVTLTRLEIADNIVTGNTTAMGGGGVFVAFPGASLTVRYSTFKNNSSTAGGAITVISSAKILVENSLFVGNKTTVANSGGAIRYTAAPLQGNFTVRNSTFTDNRSGFNGGAIGFSNLTGTAVIQNCTFTGNIAGEISPPNTGGGGAIGTNAGTGEIVLQSCIVSGNMIMAGGTGTGPDFFMGGKLSASNSLIGSSTGVSTFNPDLITTNLLGQNPLLDVLADNNGPTLTMKLLSGSPAFGKGSNPSGAKFDQRGIGFLREDPLGFPDIGAFEAPPVDPFVGSTVLPNVPPANAKYVAIVVYNDETGIDTDTIDVNDVTITGPGFATPAVPISKNITAGMKGDKSVTVPTRSMLMT